MNKDLIIYEQPLNELIRAFIRLEHLFKRIDSCINSPKSAENTQAIVSLIVDVLNLLDRPDLKSKLNKELNRLITNFSRLHSAPQISKQKLNSTLKQLDDLLHYFHNIQGKIAQDLRNNEFIANIRQCSLTTGGDSCINIPGYFYFLNQSPEIRFEYIKKWVNEFEKIQSAINLILNIVRDGSKPRQVIAGKGFYHESLDAQSHCQLIRVGIPQKERLYPEIIAGRHRMSVRFVIPDIESRPKQTSEDVSFSLTVCII